VFYTVMVPRHDVDVRLAKLYVYVINVIELGICGLYYNVTEYDNPQRLTSYSYV
jgi:hypothetical protein